MLMKLVLILVLLCCYMNNSTDAIRCYSCSDCSNTTKSTWNIIETVKTNDACIKAVILTGQNGQQLVNRGASPRCESYTSPYSSIFCCNSSLCNE